MVSDDVSASGAAPQETLQTRLRLDDFVPYLAYLHTQPKTATDTPLTTHDQQLRVS